MTDAELLERFLDHGRRGEAAEAAFAALVERHGPMVLAVCRRILRDEHDAEDAFQATFLVLVRKARTIARREVLGPWLYGVARHSAQQARARSARRRVQEREVVVMRLVEPTQDVPAPDLRSIIDEELGALPERYRAPLVLCELEGRSRKEAAALLGTPEGTISSRLARARQRLRDRLARRGLALPAAALAAALSREAAAAVLPAALEEMTVRAAMRFAAHSAAAGAVSVPVAALTEGVLKAMLLTKLKPAVLALVVGITASGAMVLAQPPGVPGNDFRVGGASIAQGQAIPPPARSEDKDTIGIAVPGPDRLQALEQKLDRILRVLEPGEPGSSRAPAAAREPASNPGTLAPPANLMAGENRPLSARQGFATPAMAPAARLPEDNLPRSWRDDVERRIARVEQRLDELVSRIERSASDRPAAGAADRPLGTGSLK
jgi:RNA polymerase sigma factor (sigma-70 family)